MSEPSRAELEAIWTPLAKRNSWELVDDEPSFLNDALTIYRTQLCQRTIAQCLRYALQRAYAGLLYTSVQQRRARGCEEILLAFQRISLRAGLGLDASTEVAQESFLRVLEHAQQLHNPQSFLFWALRIRGSVQREYLGASQDTSVDLETQEIAAPLDLAVTVEQSLVTQTLLDALRAALGNELEVVIAVRSLIEGATPREIAGDLGLKATYVRVSKSRAMQRLRANPQFMQMLRELVRDGNDAVGKGDEDEPTADQ